MLNPNQAPKSIFRSITNIKAESTLSDAFRHKHDFVDDLEAFYWTLVWIFMVHDGPSVDGILPDERQCRFTEQWKTKDSFSLFLFKTLYMRHCFDPKSARIAPYFARRPYLRLLDNLQGLLNKYNGLRDGLVLDRSGGAVESDLFPQLEEIYAQYLCYLDAAIRNLGGNPSYEPPVKDSTNILEVFKNLGADAPELDPSGSGATSQLRVEQPLSPKPTTKRRTQPGRQAKHFPVKRQPKTTTRKPHAEVQDENDSDGPPMAKRARTTRAKSHSEVQPVETRRSERLRAIQTVMVMKIEVPAAQVSRVPSGGAVKRKDRK